MLRINLEGRPKAFTKTEEEKKKEKPRERPRYTGRGIERGILFFGGIFGGIFRHSARLSLQSAIRDEKVAPSAIPPPTNFLLAFDFHGSLYLP